MSLQSTIECQSRHEPAADPSTDQVTTPPPDCCTVEVTTRRLKTLLAMSRNPDRLARRLIEIVIAELILELIRRLVPRSLALKRAAARCQQFHNEAALTMTDDLLTHLRHTDYLHDREINPNLLYLGTVVIHISECLRIVNRPKGIDKQQFIEAVQKLCAVLSRRIDIQLVNQLFVDYLFQACPTERSTDARPDK